MKLRSDISVLFATAQSNRRGATGFWRSVPGVAFLLLALPAVAQNTWQGLPLTLDTWSNPNEWSLATVPDGSTDILIPTGGVIGDVSFTNRNALNIASPAELIVLSPTTIANAGASAAVFNSGTLVNSGVIFNELSATANNSGELDNNATISNRLSGAFVNSGTLNNNAGGFLTSDLSSTVTNSGTINNNSGATLSTFGTLTNSGALNNAAGATLDNFGTLTSTGTVANSGTLNSSGTLTLQGSSATLTNSGVLLTNGGVTLINTQPIQNAGGTIAVAGGGTVALESVIVGGTLENTGGTLGALLADTTNQLDGSAAGPVTIKGVYTNAPGNRTNIAGTIINQGEIQVNDSELAILTDIVLQGGGAITLAGGPSTFLMKFGGNVTNVDNTIQGAGTIGGGSGGHVENQAAGTILANAPGQTLTVVGPTLTNAGTVQVAAGSTLHTFATIVQTGGRTLVDGTLTLDGGETISDGLLLGTGFINNSIQMTGGTIQPGELTTPGVLTFNGDAHSSVVLSLSSTVFNELIDGAGNGLLIVGGNLALGPDALLNIDLLTGFTPSLGQSFTLAEFAGLTGTFDNTPPAGFVMDGFNWTIAYNANDIVLDAVSPVPPPPSVPDSGAGTITLLALGLLTLFAAGRARFAPSAGPGYGRAA